MPTEIRVSGGYGRGIKREVVIQVGKQYVIQPLNPRAMKNRGRVIEVLGFKNDSWKDTVVEVRYLDTNRHGRVVDLSDLVPLEQGI